ncbi:hypothetical protein HNP37_000289 [Flavobacterium nitrogenifigens]|uniref:Uncharacterized protein n=2 Tax=Flavobacterium TaxID=237 RepID=A0A7W7IUN3_9FLAO|nr:MULTISPECIES: hypothetical protein [Flavobacterium]MBB4800250.1 hypothetical protein [Flavobacterium nitrogenifigens]MBB6386000.1 hypothetical protein [Flavobacterium notoginsengisoli]
MKNYKIYFLVITTGCIIGCSKNAKKQMLEVTDKISNQIETISENTIETVKQYKNTIVDKITTEEIQTESITTLSDSIAKPEVENDKFLGITSFKKFMSEWKTGETLTQKDLIENHDVPADGIKLIKSITKTAEDEIEIKWKSTWFIETISDAKFKDAKIKFKFEANKMYTSGNAIGIKYKKKIYTDLIIIGTKAYIPSVKGYHWKIGK